MGASITKFAVAVMNWSPVVKFGDDIINPELAVGNDSPSMQPCMSLSLSSKQAVKLRRLFPARTSFAAMIKMHAIIKKHVQRK